MKIYIGYDPREAEAYHVCVASLIRHNLSGRALDVTPINYRLLGKNLYTRPTERRNGVLWDVLSGAPMATEFSLARFWVPHLNHRHQWALFMDCDFMFRADVSELMGLVDSRYAVQVVQHAPYTDADTKMDNQPQTRYARKNWSSLMLFNCFHENTQALHPENLNLIRGIDLHQFGWCRDEEIGALHPEWNWLEGISDPAINPKAVHFTRGIPSMPGYENSAYAEEWREYAGR
jgi:hypothetical protein